MPLKERRAGIGRKTELSSQELADLAHMRAGVPPPAELAHKLAAMLAAALRGERIEVTRTEAAADQKQGLTLVARAALAGFELVRLADGSWQASRWGQFRTLADEGEVENFLSIVGAPT